MPSIHDTIPPSSNTVSVRCINVCTDDSGVPAALLLEPVLPGREFLPIPALAFLIEHPKKRIMFDLGLRKDVDNLSPTIAQNISMPGFGLKVEKDIVEQLGAGGIKPDDVDIVIWSHTHMDHIGDMSKFPPSTTLVIGPGSDRASYPTVADAKLLDSDFANREVREVSFTDASLTIADRRIIDFLGDGSLYLIDMPGHCPGNLVALARVTPSTFLLLGGDTAHHAGQIRPNAHIHKTCPCPASILESTRESVSTKYFSPESTYFDLQSRTEPLLSVTSMIPSFYADRAMSIESQKALGVLDADPDVLVILAHDPTLLGVIDMFPSTLDAWKENGWKEQVVWEFLKEESLAFRFN
ncbi:metallo-beta-lactamase superfamily protein [Moniliophthora roreri MCA 2997]|uniref:Metallo-beta-lactamase superfamily protein n=1 Tax=Moniliophthora roreri (strain MCA 2997) TaxID=1381753 RepID=V2WMN4_MONRO|nr:metallo-beta-lactamase superfamily protein [Moniliophthora roreri MCA 2997]